ncbi:hypothetical protein [Muribaculum intestinale]|uniref:hypothetical protein n=1 Tax=Muribaculum intestinale TaxID=1796646 RepID=UPI003F6812B9
MATLGYNPRSGKTGIGVPEILQAIVHRIPAPQATPMRHCKLYIFDSVFNPFRGIIAYYKIVNGTIPQGRFCKIRFYRQRIPCRRK